MTTQTGKKLTDLTATTSAALSDLLYGLQGGNNVAMSLAAALTARKVFVPQLFGGVADGSHDDTAAVQAAVDAADLVAGHVHFPPPPTNGFYKITAPIVIQPGGSAGSGAGQCRIKMTGFGGFKYIQYAGPSNSPVFVLHGVKDSYFEGVNVLVQDGISGVVVWDCQPTSVAGSMNNVKWPKCRIQFGSSVSAGNNVGWRTGQGGGFSDHADFYWDHCEITGTLATAGDVGWQMGGSQTTPQTFVGCSGSSLSRLYLAGPVGTTTTGSVLAGDATFPVADTTCFKAAGECQVNSERFTYAGKTATTLTGCVRGVHGTSAAAYSGSGYVVSQYVYNDAGGWHDVGAYVGAGSLTWVSGGGSGNLVDFHFQGGGRFNIIGHRAENGFRFLETGYGVSGAPSAVDINGLELSTYGNAADGVVFLFKNNCNFALRNFVFGGNGSSPFDARLFTEAAATTLGSMHIEDGVILGTDPCYTTPLSWPVFVGNVQLMNASGVVTGKFADTAPVGVPGLAQANTFSVGPQTLTPDSDAHRGWVAKGHSATQSANLFEAQTSGSAVVWGVSADPTLVCDASPAQAVTSGSNVRVYNIAPSITTTGGASSANYNAVYVQPSVSGANNITATVRALDFLVFHNSTGLVATCEGVSGSVQVNNATVAGGFSQCTNARGARYGVDHEGSGTVVSAFGASFFVTCGANGGTITNGHALFVESPGGTGAVANLHGVVVQNQGRSGVTNATAIRVDSQSGAGTSNLSIDLAGGDMKLGGSNADKLAFMGVALAAQQANASQATISAISDANAKAVCQAFYNLLKNYGLAPATS